MDVNCFNHQEILIIRASHQFAYLLLVYILVRLIIFSDNFSSLILLPLFQLFNQLRYESHLVNKSLLLWCVHLLFNFGRSLGTKLHLKVINLLLLLHHSVSNQYLLASLLLGLRTVACLWLYFQALHWWRYGRHCIWLLINTFSGPLSRCRSTVGPRIRFIDLIGLLFLAFKLELKLQTELFELSHVFL